MPTRISMGESPRLNVQDCKVVLSKFEVQSSYSVHFWTNTLGKNKNSFKSSHRLDSTTIGLLQGWHWNYIIHKDWYAIKQVSLIKEISIDYQITHICIWIYIHTHIYVYIYIRVCVCVRIFVYMDLRAYIWINTRTRTRTPTQSIYLFWRKNWLKKSDKIWKNERKIDKPKQKH